MKWLNVRRAFTNAYQNNNRKLEPTKGTASKRKASNKSKSSGKAKRFAEDSEENSFESPTATLDSFLRKLNSSSVTKPVARKSNPDNISSNNFTTE